MNPRNRNILFKCMGVILLLTMFCGHITPFVGEKVGMEKTEKIDLEESETEEKDNEEEEKDIKEWLAYPYDLAKAESGDMSRHVMVDTQLVSFPLSETPFSPPDDIFIIS